jgi:hypothetical protein
VTRKGKSPTGEAPQHAAAADSPDQSELEEEKRAIIRGVLDQAGMKPTKEIVERLIGSVHSSMAAFRQAASQITARERHDAIRALLRLAEEGDPPVAVIRKRITELPVVDIAEAEKRARRLWPRVFRSQDLESEFDFVTWSQTAPVADLLEAVRTFFSNGGTVVRGRARPGSKRSKSGLEPLILGQARGAASPSRAKAEPPTGRSENQLPSPGIGRPRADGADKLVMHLAIDWHLVTGLEPQPGRSDQSAFGALVHHVFSWLGIETAGQSLRRYWDHVQDAEIIPIERGQLLR